MRLKNLTWQEAHWLRCAVLIASRHVAQGSEGWQSYMSILNKLSAAEEEALTLPGIKIDIPPVNNGRGGDRP